MHAIRRFVLLLLIFVAGLAGASDDRTSPESVVVHCIADFRDWNDNAFQSDVRLLKGIGMKEAALAFVPLLQKNCLPAYKGQPIAYGSGSFHMPEFEQIVSKAGGNNKVIVKTRSHPKIVPSMAIDFEYRVVLANNRGYLDEVFYVDAVGKYKSL